MNILPPSFARAWDDCDVEERAKLLAYEQIRQHEEDQRFAISLGAKV
jgi:hypothetical protein